LRACIGAQDARSALWFLATSADGELFQGLRVVVASARNWAHYIGLIVAGSMVCVLYTVLCRFTLVPRALAASPAASTMLSSGEAP